MERRVILCEADLEFLKDFNWKLFALDTETTSLNWYKQKVEGVSLSDGKKTCYIVGEKLSSLVLLIGATVEPRIVIMHNATFDIKAVQKLGIAPHGEVFDTMVAAHLLDEEGPKGLKALAEKYLEKTVVTYEEAVKKGTNSAEFYNYAMNDAEWTFELAMMQRPLLQEQGLTKLFREVEMPFLKVLARMEMNGVLVDLDNVLNTTKTLREEIRRLEEEMLGLLGEQYSVQYDLFGNYTISTEMNFSSSQQLQHLLFNKLGISSAGLETTPTGTVKVDKTNLEKIKDKHPFIPLLIKYKIAQKLLTAFFMPLPDMVDKDGRVRPHFNDCGTVTGRLSCSGPNLQQLPKVNKDFPINTRNCFIAPNGKKLISIDYSQQELRIMTELSQDPQLIKIISGGGDLHLINANLVFNLGIPEEKLYETHPEYDSIKKQYKRDRDNGKVFSFGIPYGMGEHKLSRDFNISTEEAKVLLSNFFSGFPGLERAIRSCHTEAEKSLYVTTYTGRRRHFKKNQWGKLESSALRQSFNFLIQSYGADLIRMACIKLQDFADKNPGYGIKLIMTVHDEVVIEVNKGYAEEVAKKAQGLFESCASMCVPLLSSASVGNTYGDCK